MYLAMPSRKTDDFGKSLKKAKIKGMQSWPSTPQEKVQRKPNLAILKTMINGIKSLMISKILKNTWDEK